MSFMVLPTGESVLCKVGRPYFSAAGVLKNSMHMTSCRSGVKWPTFFSLQPSSNDLTLVPDLHHVQKVPWRGCTLFSEILSLAERLIALFSFIAFRVASLPSYPHFFPQAPVSNSIFEFGSTYPIFPPG